MKAFRIKLSKVNSLDYKFKFLLLSECSMLKINYNIENQESQISIQTIHTNHYILSKKMNYLDFVLFEIKFLRFKDSDELFFNLGDFYLLEM
jgi:hypothetical protein